MNYEYLPAWLPPGAYVEMANGQILTLREYQECNRKLDELFAAFPGKRSYDASSSGVRQPASTATDGARPKQDSDLITDFLNSARSFKKRSMGSVPTADASSRPATSPSTTLFQLAEEASMRGKTSKCAAKDVTRSKGPSRRTNSRA